MSFDGVSMSTESMKDMTCPEELSAECRVKVIQNPKDQSTSNSKLPVSHERLDRGHPMTVADSPPQFKGWGVLRLRQSICGPTIGNYNLLEKDAGRSTLMPAKRRAM
ncbi:unnamed protein product [Nippostrongylus brasiliensis]|uniref:Uncharacterized protein n=1 Tax=Nippostrongylus brasiliensis TaxID=27835 RepID=A0A0N4YKJ1_NIPBR|nr:unnamed protein product [Nippostrongylus brasiliensis]